MNPRESGAAFALALSTLAGCAVGGTTDGGDGLDAVRMDVASEHAVDAPIDVPPPMDVFACSGSTCSVANGTGRCVNGICEIAMCMPGAYDTDHNARNGCECVVGVVATSCASATDLGSLGPGSMHLVQSLMPPGVTEHWVRVAFDSPGREHIEFADNPGGTYRFDVSTACGAGAMCPDRTEGATGLTSWEFTDSPVDPAMSPRTDLPTRMAEYPAALWIRITTSRASTRCEPYTLVVGNDR